MHALSAGLGTYLRQQLVTLITMCLLWHLARCSRLMLDAEDVRKQ